MPKKTAKPKSGDSAIKEQISVQGNITGDDIVVGSHNQIIRVNKSANNLVPDLNEENNPIPSNLDLYRDSPMAAVGRLFNKYDVLGVMALFVIAFLTYAGGVFLLRTFQGTSLPPAFADFVFYIAPGERFYYPDWNALAFDFILNPLAVTLSFFYPAIFFELGSYLFKAGVLKPNLKWDHYLVSKLWIMGIKLIPFLLGVMAIGVSWFSRYRYYVNDLYALRFYVLGLIGLSTYLRTALIIFALHSVFLLGSSNLEFIDILNPASRSKYAKFGDLCLLIIYCCLLIFCYAMTTLYTSIFKGVYLPDDYLSWEAFIHLIIVIFLFCYFIYLQFQAAGQIRRIKDKFASEILTPRANAESISVATAIIKDTSNYPLVMSVVVNSFPTAVVLIVDLLPITLYTIGSSSR